jgi:hypothetical protein
VEPVVEALGGAGASKRPQYAECINDMRHACKPYVECIQEKLHHRQNR